MEVIERKNEKWPKKFAIQFSNIYCDFLFMLLKPTREINRQRKYASFSKNIKTFKSINIVCDKIVKFMSLL